MDIIIVDRDLNYSKKLMVEISKTFKEYRVIFISDNEEEFKDFIKYNFFDIVIMEDYFIEKCPEIFQYKVHKICVFGSDFKLSSRFASVRRESEKVIENHLAKILSTPLSTVNNEVREFIKKELEYLGYNFSLRGTKYLEDAISLMYLKNCDRNLEREVYSQLSKAYKKSSHNIKVNIQNSTNIMISNYGYDRVLDYLEINSSYGIGTKAIICAILNKIKIKFRRKKSEPKRKVESMVRV